LTIPELNIRPFGFYGKSHSDETRRRMSEAHLGITPTNAMTIYVYSIEGVLVNQFSSQIPPLAAKELGLSRQTVRVYLSNQVSH
jgi:hypothetical protein